MTRLVLLALLAACGGHHHHGHHDMRFQDAAKWSRVFDDPARDEWQKPDEVVAALALQPSDVVADVGAGTGYFAVRLARVVPDGKVYAVDVEPDMVRHLGERAQTEGLANVVPVLGAVGDANLPGPTDVVLLVDTYHHVADRVAYFRTLRADLAPGGRLVIVDFTPDSPSGPPPEHRIPAAVVERELDEAGFVKTGQRDFLPRQFFLEFQAKP